MSTHLKIALNFLILSILLVSVFTSFSASADGLSLRVLTVSNFSKADSYRVQSRFGISYSKDSYRVGINEGFLKLPVIHAVKEFPINSFMTFGAGLETGYTAYESSSKYYLKEDFSDFNFMLSLNLKLHKNISVFLTGNNASLELNF